MESCKNGADLEQIMNYKTRHLKTRFFSFINDQNIPSSLIGGGGVLGIFVYPGFFTVGFPIFLVAGGLFIRYFF